MKSDYAIEHLKTIGVTVDLKSKTITGGEPFIYNDASVLYLVIDGWLTSKDLLALSTVMDAIAK